MQTLSILMLENLKEKLSRFLTENDSNMSIEDKSLEISKINNIVGISLIKGFESDNLKLVISLDNLKNVYLEEEKKNNYFT